MNIFVINSCPIQSAIEHCDKHCIKQIVEQFQMLGSAVIRHGATPEEMPLTSKGTPLKGGYHYHPCTVWLGESRENFIWSYTHALALCKEYTFRYGKIHACEKGIRHLTSMENKIPSSKQTKFAIAIADTMLCRKDPNFNIDNPVECYKLYYKYDKRYFAKWTKRQTPEWFNL
jgi:hypothetical protein